MVRQKKSFHDILEILPICYSESFSSYWIDWKLSPEDKRIHPKPRTDYFIFQSSQKCCDLCLVLYLCVFFVGYAEPSNTVQPKIWNFSCLPHHYTFPYFYNENCYTVLFFYFFFAFLKYFLTVSKLLCKKIIKGKNF